MITNVSSIFVDLIMEAVSDIDGVFELDREYSKIEFSGCTGRLEGKKVILESEIHAFNFISFKAYD